MQNLNLQILWLNDSLGFCINCQTPKGIIPLTSYYFWPISDAWEQLKVELDSKLESSYKTTIEKLVADLEVAVQKDDFKSMETLSEDLKKKMMEIGQKVYSQDGETNTESGSNPVNDEPIETDFSVEK